MSLIARRLVGLVSPNRDQTRVPCIERQILNHWTAKEVPEEIQNVDSSTVVFI